MRRAFGLLLTIAAVHALPCHAQVRAAGMALRDGALPPGTLTVRVVRGGFSNNVPNHAVTIDVDGVVTQNALTGPDGRATFAHLAVGARVRASATVDGESLESEVFEVPGQSGVRILLIAGGESADGAVSGPATPPTDPVVPAVTVLPPGAATSSPIRSDASIARIRFAWVALTLAMSVYVSRPWWSRQAAARKARRGSTE